MRKRADNNNSRDCTLDLFLPLQPVLAFGTAINRKVQENLMRQSIRQLFPKSTITRVTILLFAVMCALAIGSFIVTTSHVALASSASAPTLKPIVSSGQTAKPIPIVSSGQTAKPIPTVPSGQTAKPIPTVSSGQTAKPIPTVPSGQTAKPIPTVPSGQASTLTAIASK